MCVCVNMLPPFALAAQRGPPFGSPCRVAPIQADQRCVANVVHKTKEHRVVNQQTVLNPLDSSTPETPNRF